MLAATHTPQAPWTLVDFNDQRLGRLTLLRDLLDRLPDTKLPIENIPWPPLDHEPIEERYGVTETDRSRTAGRTGAISLSSLCIGWGGRPCEHQDYSSS